MTETTIDTPAGDDGSRILSLFRDWMTAIRAASAVVETDERAWEAACDRAQKLADAIMLTPATSAAGLAIKTYLAAHDDDSRRREDAAALSDEILGERARALIKDAVHFVPELGPLATDAIKVMPSAKASVAATAAGKIDAAAPVADRLLASVTAAIERLVVSTVPEVPDGAKFLAAEREIAEVNRLAKLAGDDEEIYQRYGAANDFIELTEPQSLAAVAVKLRRLFGSGGALDGFDREIGSVRQCIAFLDREIASQRELAQGEQAPTEPEGSSTMANSTMTPAERAFAEFMGSIEPEGDDVIGFGEPEPRLLFAEAGAAPLAAAQ